MWFCCLFFLNLTMPIHCFEVNRPRNNVIEGFTNSTFFLIIISKCRYRILYGCTKLSSISEFLIFYKTWVKLEEFWKKCIHHNRGLFSIADLFSLGYDNEYEHLYIRKLSRQCNFHHVVTIILMNTSIYNKCKYVCRCLCIAKIISS